MHGDVVDAVRRLASEAQAADRLGPEVQAALACPLGSTPIVHFALGHALRSKEPSTERQPGGGRGEGTVDGLPARV